MYKENAIIKDLRVLTEQFIPRRIIHREGQLREISDNLKPLIDREIPRSSFLYGPPGTGKTCMSQFVVDELKAYAPVVSAYINCWSYPSRFKILFNIIQTMGHNFLHRKGTPTDELIDILRSKSMVKPCVIILDEADQLEDDKVLYDLAEMEGICLILIANTQTLFYAADPRIRSRLQSLDRIEFRPYSTLEIIEILKDRAELGLVPSAIDTQQINRIAEACEGDARMAISTLRAAAELAEKQDSQKILDIHIQKAIPITISSEANKALSALNTYQKILYGIIKSAKQLQATELHTRFESICAEKGLEPIVDRTARKYLDRLESLGLITKSGNDRWTIYRVIA